MLSYQHMYHAGGLYDIQKHSALCLLLEQMLKKDKALTYVETHAGRGLYDLSSAESLKTGEASAGIIKLLASSAIDHAHPYAKVLELVRKKYGDHYYPGSPLIAQTLLRDCDKIFLSELHPQEYAMLVKHVKRNVTVTKGDGYQAALAVAPALIKRGFVFIDPSYEIKSEYQKIADFIIKLHKKWPVAVILLWYPLLGDHSHQEMTSFLINQNFNKLWQQEIIFKNSAAYRSIGSGLICINTPFGIEEELNKIVSYMSILSSL